MARTGDTPDYVRRMQQELFDLLSKARSRGRSCRGLSPRPRRCAGGTWGREADVRELAIHRRVSRLIYSRRCAEASAVRAHMKQGIPLAPGMEIGYVVKDAGRWEVDPEGSASEFDAGYYGKLLEKAWSEVAFVFERAKQRR